MHTADIAAVDSTLVLLAVEEAARRLRIGRTTCYQRIRSGDLESIDIGRLRRVPADPCGRVPRPPPRSQTSRLTTPGAAALPDKDSPPPWSPSRHPEQEPVCGRRKEAHPLCQR